MPETPRTRKAVITVSLPLEITEELVRDARRMECSLGDALLAALLQGTFVAHTRTAGVS